MTGCRPRLGDEIVEPDVTKARRRAMVTAGTAVSLVVSLIGGTLALLFTAGPEQSTTALKPLPPPVSAPVIEPEPASSGGGGTDLSMFGFGDSSSSSMAGSDSSASSMAGSSSPVSNMAGASGGVAPSAFTPMASNALPPLPTLQLPDASAVPAGPAFDWNALLAPLVAAQANAQAANVAGSIIGGSVGIANSVAVVLGDLILFAAYTNNGQPLLTALQNTMAAPAAAAAAGTALVAGMPPMPALPDLSGLTAAFAAAATAPPLGVPAPPALPPMPTPDQLAASVAGLSALGALPGLPALSLPGLPPLPGTPQLPRPEEVVGGLVGGAVAIGVGGLILGTLFPPPSITRMLGMPF